MPIQNLDRRGFSPSHMPMLIPVLRIAAIDPAATLREE